MGRAGNATVQVNTFENVTVGPERPIRLTIVTPLDAASSDASIASATLSFGTQQVHYGLGRVPNRRDWWRAGTSDPAWSVRSHRHVDLTMGDLEFEEVNGNAQTVFSALPL